ncbi:DUF6212 domain-containing protein [Roseomonas populi]|uniref:DUF6212 domain-containing protein n=1 Tax=Roseomonas populi TaxID=3121582 RepID=A0ABT1X5L3_9PROT|nr:DUF6212 domain-containing protein [Roseomonas pecuniae]MCR0982457.1 DUF6212 domain-containing protein [Roseomonas pecuniae]
MLHADPLHLPRLAGGRPMVIVAEGVMDPSPLATPSLEVWMASPRQGVTLLHPAGTRAPDPAAATPLETPPAAAVALIASERLRIAALSRWWEEAAGLPAPPFLLASTGQAALPGLLALVTEALAAARTREAQSAGAVVAGRQEMELSREAMADAARYLAHRPPAAPRLVLSGEAGDGPPITGAFRQPLGTGLAGLAAIAVHLAGTGSGDGLLRVRLIGAEGGRVVGSWAVPASALAPGWLTLDLPTPLGPQKETAVLEVAPEGEGLPGLSRDARWSGPEGEHGVAASAWAGTPGSRYLAPSHWMPEEAGLVLPGDGVPLGLPESAWAAARALEGEAEAVALGEEPPRPVLRAAAKGRAVLLLPHLHLPGLDRLQITLNGGKGAEVAAWVYPLDSVPEDAAELERLSSGSAGTGWRTVPEEGLELTLPLSARLAGRAGLAVALRAGDEPATAEIAGVTASSVRPSAPEPEPAAALPSDSVASVEPPAPSQPSGTEAAPAAPAAAAPPAPTPDPVPAAPVVAVPTPAPGARPEPEVVTPAAPPLPAGLPVMPPPVVTAPPQTELQPAQPQPAVAAAPPPAALPEAPPIALVPRISEALRPTIALSVPMPGQPMAPPIPGAGPAPGPAAPPLSAVPPVAPPAPRAPEPAPAPAQGTASSLFAPQPAGAGAGAPQPVRAVPTNVQPGRAPARFEAVRLHQHLPGPSYRHLDMTVASLAAGPTRWASVRVKLQSKDGEPRLEFRQAAGWPHMFRDWLGRTSDKFGPFLRVSAPELQGFLDTITDERDAAMMQALLAVLPRAVEDACRQAGLSVAETNEWAETAKGLQEESRPAG